MALITTIEDFKKYLKVAGTLKIDSLTPFIKDAQAKYEYLRRWLGKDLLDLLNEYYNAEEIEADAALDALLPYVQNALAKFTMYLAAPALDLQITEGGFAVVSNNNLTPASQQRVQAFRDGMLEQGWNAIEDMLAFLESNAVSYDDWVASEGYTETFSNFVRNAAQFDKIIPINGSRLRFQQLRTEMDNVCLLKIFPVISKDLADVIFAELKSGEVSEENQKILPYLQRAEAHLTAFAAGMGDKHENTGNAFLAEVKKIIDAEPDDYPEYRDSDSYDDTKTSYRTYENKSENKIFNFGN